MVKIVVDMMGGDNGSAATVQGVLDFLKEYKDVHFYCVGRIEELSKLENNESVSLVDARDIVPMQAGAMDALRSKNSSMVVAAETFIKKQADAIVSCGSTGGFLSVTSVKLKKIPGVLRPALITSFPTEIKGKKVTVCDVGASNENSPEELVQFACMGEHYVRAVYGIEEPNIYLLANGSEEGKGSPEAKEAYKLLKTNKYFKGNLEGRDALSGEADLLVTDGFSGNVFLKTAEGVGIAMKNGIKKAFKRNLFTKIGYIFAKKGFDELSETFDHKSVGGAMLVGINGIAVKAHGNSDAYGFKCGIRVAYKLAKGDVVNKIKEGVANA